MHRTYTPDGSIDVNVVVRDGDVFCVPRGYHGPCIAAPGYPMYYLNVLAGPGGSRSMAFCDDPTHHWVRDTWAGMATDPRCPVTTKEGRTSDQDRDRRDRLRLDGAGPQPGLPARTELLPRPRLRARTGGRQRHRRGAGATTP